MKILLPLAILLMPAWAFAVDECECQPIVYEDLMNMTASEVSIKMEAYARYKEAYSRRGSTYCYYSCANEYDHLRNIWQDKEIERSKQRLNRQAAEPGKTGANPGSVPRLDEFR